jgi:hypothetical protein
VRAGGVLLAAAVALACQPTERPALHVSNGTAIDVAVFVNGVQAAVVAPRGPMPEIDETRFPPLRWDVVARSPTGRVLATMRVVPGQVSSTTGPEGLKSSTGAIARVDLSCGRLTLWAGDIAPSGPPPPAHPGQPGDCAP